MIPAKLIKEIRALSVAEREQLIKLIADTLPDEDESQKPHDIMEFLGVGAEMWQGIDAQEYVNQLRDEWRQDQDNQSFETGSNT